MTQTDVVPDGLDQLLIQIDVKSMSFHVLGIHYDELKALIYPRPPYKHFIVAKRDGSPRALAEPLLPLKLLQYRALAYLKSRVSPFRPAVHGFVEGRSILTNARQHCHPTQHQILNLDLEDFFPSISFYRVRGVLQAHPFYFSHEVATVLAHLCTLNGGLPQGAPTSPFFANLVCRGLDRDLTNVARRYRAIYTRYADDITLSFNVRSAERLPMAICSVQDGQVSIGKELTDVISDHSFKVNPNKTRLRGRFQRMEVTGLTVNKFPNVRRRFVDKIRGALNAWEKYGYKAAAEVWERRALDPSIAYEKRPWKRQTRIKKVAELKNVIWGKLLYLRMVRGEDDVLYARLADRYNAVVKSGIVEGDFSAPLLPVQAIVRSPRDVDDGVFVLEWSGDYKSGTLEDMVGGQGTAFGYRETNLLVTCDHVLGADVKIGKFEGRVDYDAPEIHGKVIQLVQPRTRRTWPAKVLFRDRQLDIALIAFDMDEPPSHRYFRAMTEPIQPGASGFLIGFPNYQNGKLPNVLGDRVLNRTMPNKGMNSFTIENAASIRPGNSGGPFTNDSFRIAGVAQRGAYMGAGDDECLCFTIVDSIVLRWKETLRASTQEN